MSEGALPRMEPEDLSVQVRRGHASPADERALERALARDEKLRVAHQVGLDLDRETSVRAGDEELILRAADAALARAVAAEAPAPGPPAGRALRFFSWQMVAGLAAAFALSCSGIGAALWVAGVTPWHKPALENPAPAPQPVRARAHKPSPRSMAPVETPVPAPILVEVPPPAVSHGHHAHAPRALAAGALFHAANSARRVGDFTRAKRLYAELIAAAPRSEEAHVAHVSLGKLLLGQGQAAAAEREFQRYLLAGGGTLSEEALFGRARSLLRLGRLREEQSAWRALLGAYPDSVYAVEARERLSVR